MCLPVPYTYSWVMPLTSDDFGSRRILSAPFFALRGSGRPAVVREHGTGADVRDTQHRDGATLSFPAVEWAALLRTGH